MSLGYRAVGWNRNKRRYDGALGAGVLLWLGVFLGAGFALAPEATAEVMLIRATGAGAFALLHVILCIGPLCRLDARFLPLLYNRRHMGVTMFFLALVHAALTIATYHAMGNVSPITSVLSGANGPLFADLAFQPFGFAAFLILALMACTSHDFWLANLTAPVWKALHMLVYVAWGLLVLHVLLGVAQAEASTVLVAFTLGGGALVAGLHLWAGLRERGRDREADPGSDGWVDVGAVDALADGSATTVSVGGERVAIVRWEGKFAALSNACQHQNGPLGEGRVIDGCLTCPWHGYQYDPETGCSPPPFTERVPTFPTRVVDGRIQVAAVPRPAGTRCAPSRVEEHGP